MKNWIRTGALIGIMLFAGAYFIPGYAQSDAPVDTVCAGSNEYYKVVKTLGSSYDWYISKGGKPIYGVDRKADSILVEWSNSNIMTEEFVKVLETNKYGRKGDTIILKVLKFPVPTATISGTDTLFDGNNGSEKIIVTLTGTPPWDIVYFDGKTNNNANDIQASPYTIPTRPLSNPPEVHTFSLVSVKNKSGCPGAVSGAANITVSPPIKTSGIIHK